MIGKFQSGEASHRPKGQQIGERNLAQMSQIEKKYFFEHDQLAPISRQ